MEVFVSGSTARCAAELVGVNFETASCYFHRLRTFISGTHAGFGPLSLGFWEMPELSSDAQQKGFGGECQERTRGVEEGE